MSPIQAKVAVIAFELRRRLPGRLDLLGDEGTAFVYLALAAVWTFGRR